MQFDRVHFATVREFSCQDIKVAGCPSQREVFHEVPA